MIIAMARDIRVILIKLADRTHNMRTLSHLPPERQTEIAQETIDIYAPLAHRLGIYWIKSELEDNALRYMHPEIYYQLKRNVAKKKTEREQYIEHVRGVLSKKLEAAGLEATITGRPKHFYSIYQKMQTQHLLYDQIYDLVAFRCSSTRRASATRRSASCTRTGSRCPAASATTSPCRRRTCTSRCTPP
jgi:GTP pyrophosphokinase